MLNLNTSHVKVQQEYCKINPIKIINLNTSHVKVQPMQTIDSAIKGVAFKYISC